MATQDGLLEWANSIRFSISNDPGRQMFQDHVQMHGFLYLSDYFDEIMARGKQGTLIDLVKTPGRRRPLETTNETTLSIHRDSPSLVEPGNKENHSSATPQHHSSLEMDTKNVSVAMVHDVAASESRQLPVIAEGDESFERSLVVEFSTLPSPPPTATETTLTEIPSPLPISAEMKDVNQDTSRPSLPSDTPSAQDVPKGPLPPSGSLLSDAIPDDDVSMNESHPLSFPPSSGLPIQPANGNPTREPIEETLDNADKTQEVGQEWGSSSLSEKTDTTNLLVVTEEDSVKSVNTTTLTTQPDKTQEQLEHRSAPEGLKVSSSPPSLAPRHTSYAFLPDPIPLPKLARDPSNNFHSTKLSIDKGSSWLMKSRANAIDHTTRLPSSMERAGTNTSHKRKSTEMLGHPDSSEDATRHSKVSKQGEMDTAPESAVSQASIPEEGSGENSNHGMLDRLRKTLEGFGGKPGKAVEKVLGRPAALAEARAAAEVRVAERNKDTMSTNSTQPDRLSLSDLVRPLEQGTQPSSSAAHRPPLPPLHPPREPVFRPPSGSARPIKNNLPSEFTNVAPMQSSPPFSRPAPMSVGLGPRLPSPKSNHDKPRPVTAQSSVDSAMSVSIFDGSQGAAPAWMPSTQDTDHAFLSPTADDIDDDDDDSFMGGSIPERFRFMRDDSMTWSSAPTESRKLDFSGPLEQTTGSVEQVASLHDDGVQRGLHVSDGEGPFRTEQDRYPHSLSESAGTSFRQAFEESELPAEATQPQGLLGHATKLVNSVLGTGKKVVKPELKSLQLAAAAAKKEQEDKDKKAAYRKNMEDRRQFVSQKRAEELKVKAQEEEKRMKEDAERRKREREDLTDKRLLKLKKDEEASKKRKIIPEPEKKPEIKKPVVTLKPMKLLPKQPAASSAIPVQVKGKAPVKAPTTEDDVSDPSALLRSQMAARVQAAQHQVASEEIDLPDIRSEYSGSDDEDDPKKYAPPHWAQSPELRHALEGQSGMNPEAIFGPIQPLRMEDMFHGRVSRFRARTSSANWSGADRLTKEEEMEYVRRMGFK